MDKIRNILLVDDDSISCWLNQTLLERTGLVEKVDTLHDGRAAINFLQQSCSDEACSEARCPDLILLDLDMPGVNGFDVLDTLQQSEETAWLISDRIIVLTTTINPKDLERAELYDIYDFLIKPLTESKISRVLGQFSIRNS